jgi:hypothetical protein
MSCTILNVVVTAYDRGTAYSVVTFYTTSSNKFYCRRPDCVGWAGCARGFLAWQCDARSHEPSTPFGVTHPAMSAGKPVTSHHTPSRDQVGQMAWFSGELFVPGTILSSSLRRDAEYTKTLNSFFFQAPCLSYGNARLWINTVDVWIM